MKWTVVWTANAHKELVNIWLQAGDRQNVTKAANQAELLLKRRPDQVGESREQLERILIEWPLTFRYRLIPDDCLVEVLGVWPILSRR